jgi:hypothetical protein
MSKETRDVCGYILTTEDGIIISAEQTGFRVEIGQKIYSNGRMFVPEGTPGTVLEIMMRYHRSSV